MILLKANPELKKVFLSLIKTLGTNVVWNHVFVVTNNTIILPGKVRSLFFNYDTKQIYTNLIDLDVEESNIVEIINDDMLVNTLNMTLYAFGKWGAINGLRVEKDYAQLNRLFSHILQDIKVEPSFRDDNFRFYKNKILVSYEDIIQEILNLSNPEQSTESSPNTEDKKDKNKEGQKDKQEKKTDEGEPSPDSRWKSPVSQNDDDEEYQLGLWHNIKWITKPMSFAKTERKEKEANSRLGNSFYPVDYKCPSCGKKLYISLFPVNREFPIETDEGKVYLARAYTCNACNCFYTPRPDKLLEEGDIYSLEFDEDRTAYEDYLELLGNAGERCANYKFNEYEAQHNKNKNLPAPHTLDQICDNLDSIPAEELNKLEDKIFSGFYPETAVEKFYPSISKEKKRKSRKKTKKSSIQEKGEDKTDGVSPKFNPEAIASSKSNSSYHNPRGIHNQDFSVKSADELKDILLQLSNQNSMDEETAQVFNTVKKQLTQKLKEKYDAHMAVVQRMSPKQLKDLKLRIESEQAMDTAEKKPYLEQINKILYHNQKKILEEKASACKGKSYHEINRVIEEIKELKDTDIPPTVKKPILDTLYEQRKKSGEKEVEYLMSTLPPQLNKRQFEQFLDKLRKYEEVDISPYEKQLEQRRGLVEQQEINSFIARSNKKDRDSLYQLYQDLKEQGFSEKNVQPYLDKIHNKIYALDQEALQKLLPSAVDMTFEDGLKAMEKIKNGVFLPEIKIDALEMLDKRLTKLKVDECDQLARKLKRELTPQIKDLSRFHFYEARKAMRGDMEEEEAAVFDKALNSYASDRNPYEYPILLSDSARFPNGKEGFVLTPDHIFYNSLLHSGVVSIMDIDTIEEKNGFINKGVFAEKNTGDKVKLPISINSKEWKSFAKAMNSFIDYLQEKPESRNVSYLAKEKHEKKCCIRCGYVYTDGEICPKCGSKNNK